MNDQNKNIEWFDGSRSAKQILCRMNLFGLKRANERSCIDKKSNSTLLINQLKNTISTFPSIHIGHGDLSPCHIEVLRAIVRMKKEVLAQPNKDKKYI